ncbi:MAG TPA: biopolymer transporter ExbD [Gemmataceae bacterium]|nr:biopolymer transporter ExbD [Gemmataceae bacterium]
MTWRIRHQGSPRAVEGLTLDEVVEGLQDGLWEPTDEVMGPLDRDWVALESHPQFADLAMDLDTHPPRHYDDETHLDFNPLIDVCLVLLIFFILTTSYAALQKVLPMPGVSAQSVKGPPVVTQEQVRQFMIKVEARQENGKPVVRVEGKPVEPLEPDTLVGVIGQWVKKERKTELLIDAADVDWGTVVAIQDAAKGAGVEKVHLLERTEEAK